MGLVGSNVSIQNAQARDWPYINATSLFSTGSVTTTGLPPNARTGDVMIAAYVQQQFGGVGPNYWTPPAGWTEQLELNGPVSGVSYRTVQAGDAGFTWTALLTTQQTAFLQLAFRGVVIDQLGTASTPVNNNATISLPSITTTANNCVILALVISAEAYRAPAAISGYTLRASTIPQQADSSRPALFAYVTNKATAGATGAVTTNFSDGIGSHYGLLISLKPS